MAYKSEFFKSREPKRVVELSPEQSGPQQYKPKYKSKYFQATAPKEVKTISAQELISTVKPPVKPKPVETPEDRIKKFSQTGYKMTKANRKEVQDYYKKFAELRRQEMKSAKTPHERAEIMKRQLADPMLQTVSTAEMKSRPLGAFTAGAVTSFVPIAKGLATPIAGAERTQEIYAPFEQQLKSVSAQTPIEAGVGQFVGKALQYGAGSQLMAGLKPIQKVGEATGKGVSALTGGKIGADVASRVATSLVGNTALDIALDTAPEAVRNAYEGKSAKEITNEALKNVGVNIAWNVGAEAIGSLFKALKNKGVSKVEAEKLKQVTDTMNDIEKSAIATESGFKSGDEMGKKIDEILMLPETATQPTLYGNEIGISSDIDKIIRPIPTVDELIQRAQIANSKGKDLTKYINDIETAKWYDSLSQQEKQLLIDTSKKEIKYSPVSARQIIAENYQPKAIISDSVIQRAKRVEAKPLNIDKTPSMSIKPTTEAPIQREPIIPQGTKERGFAETVRLKTDMPEQIKNEFVEVPEVYTVLSNKETVQKADDILSKGLEQATTEFERIIKMKDPSAIPLGSALAKQYIDSGNKEQAVNIVREMAQELTKSGQFSQAAAIALMKNDPETALRYIVRDIDNLNQSGLKKFGKKWKNFELTQSELDMFGNIKQGNTEAIANAFETVGKRLAKEYPATMFEKFVEATKISMLLNPRTNVRNYTSNLLLKPLTQLSNKTSAAMQNIYSYFNKDYKPTQAVFVDKDRKKMAEQIWDGVKDSFDNASKYDEAIKVAGKQKQVFKEGIPTNLINKLFPSALQKANALMGKDEAGLAETARNLTYYLLEVGDKPFVKSNFVNRLGSFLQAKGYKSLDDIPQEVLDEAVSIATSEALRATFKDTNNFTKMLSNIKKDTGKFGEVLLPFTKTPANIAMRTIDYSPVGLINTFKKARTGEDVSIIIDELAKNLTGTGLITLGYYLAKNGIITGNEPDNQKQAAFMRQQGWRPYSVKVGDKYITYDWAQPAATPLIMGAVINDTLEDNNSLTGGAYKGVMATANQWLQMSPLQSISEVFGGYGTVPENLAQQAAEFPQRLIPSALGATARVVDTTQRETYSKGKEIKTQFDIAKAKIPELSKDLPTKYDTWGQPVKRDETTGGAVISQYLNPGSVGVVKSQKVDGEIERLYNQVGDENIFPIKAKRTIVKENNSYDLDNKEYSKYQKIMGKQSLEAVSEFMKSKFYNSLSDDEKSKMIQGFYSVAKENADIEVLKDKGVIIKPKIKTKVLKIFPDYTPKNLVKYMVAKEIVYNTEGNKNQQGNTISGTVKFNAIKRLTDNGYSKQEAERMYRAVRDSD